MKYLLDTHTLIWFIEGDEKLPQKLRMIIETAENQICVSIASFWEMAIKQSIHKLELNSSVEDYISKVIENNMTIIPISFEHILKLTTLPFHHRDPFDRMLIAQTMVEQMTVISKDAHFSDYEVATLW
jgi:PIN domain nuclease of toxin-antitoxin system